MAASSSVQIRDLAGSTAYQIGKSSGGSVAPWSYKCPSIVHAGCLDSSQGLDASPEALSSTSCSINSSDKAFLFLSQSLGQGPA